MLTVIAKLNNALWQSSSAVLTQSAVNACILYVLYKNSCYDSVLEFLKHWDSTELVKHKFWSGLRFGECRKNLKPKSKMKSAYLHRVQYVAQTCCLEHTVKVCVPHSKSVSVGYYTVCMFMINGPVIEMLTS
jgi:hypothetical protein